MNEVDGIKERTRVQEPSPVVDTPRSGRTSSIASGSSSEIRLSRRLASEGLGTALLLATIVGSGIMGERLSGGNAAIALLANSLATGAVLVALILAFGPISGAHFNSAVTVAMAVRGRLAWRDVLPYVIVQIIGAILGVWATHFIFELPVLMTSKHARTGMPQWGSEGIATFGLLGVLFGCSKARPHAAPFAVGAYITAAYWFTSSTSFANPAVTIARSLTDTFAGIRPVDVAGFIAAQVLGAALAIALFGWMAPSSSPSEPIREDP
jgi:glycerol uptake facilitator-like aquaporin